MPWYVLYTNPRHEKKVSEQLTKKGIETYCPVYTTLVQWSDRKKKVEKPLFNSYVFVRLEDHEREKVFIVPGIVRYLYWLGKPAIIKEKEIEQIKIFLNEITPTSTLSYHSLDTVKIVEGPLKGAFGVVEKVNKTTLLLRLEQMGISIKAVVNQSDVRK